jgi:hypothetical protein
MEPSRIVVMVVLAILLVLGLYYLWKWLYGDNDMQDMVIYSSSNSGLPAKDTAATVYSGVDKVPYIYGGGEYSISTWVYVTNWNINKGKNKPFLVLSNGASGTSSLMTVVMYLGQYTNKLGVRVSCESSTASLGDLTTASYSAIVAGQSPYTDSSSDFKKCDIESIDLQKWINITAVLTGRTIDIYIDGKLSRSCLLDGIFKVDSGEKPTIKLGGPDGFGGLIGMTRAANFAYSPDRVYAYYQEGPFSRFTLGSLDLTQYSLDVKRKNSLVFSTSSK